VHFVPALYRALLQSNKLHLTTFSQCLDDGVPVEHLEALVAGSWVYGDFGTWIGDPDKNRAWDLLCDAKSEFDDRYPHINDPAHQALTLRQLAVCEGSDWFWWFGDYNPPDAVAEFDRLYRRHLATLYELLEIPVHPRLIPASASVGADRKWAVPCAAVTNESVTALASGASGRGSAAPDLAARSR